MLLLKSHDPSSRTVPGRIPALHAAEHETDAGWSSPVARQAHNLKVTGSNPVPAPILAALSVDPDGAVFGIWRNRRRRR